MQENILKFGIIFFIPDFLFFKVLTAIKKRLYLTML